MLLRTLVKKELLNNIVSLRFTLIFLLCCTLIIVSAYTMRGKYNDRMKEYSTALNIHKQELEESQGEGQGIHRIAVGGYKLDKPPTPLSAIVEGMEGAAGKFTTVNILPLSTPMLEGGTGDEPMFIYFGTLDMMYIVRAVLSLVAILLTYDAISGERERGTLKLALSNRVPRYTVILAKCIGGYITLILSFMVPLLIGLLILTTSGNVNFAGTDWGKLCLILLISVIYIGVFLMLGLLVSSRASRSTTSLVVLLFIWVVIIMAIPKISMIVASKVRRVPSVQEIQAEKDATFAQIIKEGQIRMKRERQRDANQDVTEGPEDNMILIDQGMSDDIKKSRDEIQAEYERKREAQFRLAAGISRISPASVYTYAAIGLAGTGIDRQRRFLEAARAYQVGFREYFEGIVNRSMRGGGSSDDARFDANRLPAFKFRDLTLSESWNSVKIDVLILFMLLVCLFMVSYVSFIRGDLR